MYNQENKDSEEFYKTCNVPIGYGNCDGCIAASSVMGDEDEEPRCENCGKPIYDFSDLGCHLCDARHPGFGVRQ